MASSVNYGTQQYFGFDPRTLPGCSLWLDAADARTVSFSSGSSISEWRDKSGNANNAILTANRPTYVATNRFVETSNLNQAFTVPSTVLNTVGGSLFIVYADKQENTANGMLFACADGFTPFFFNQCVFRSDGFSYALGSSDTPSTEFKNIMNTKQTLLYSTSYVHNSTSINVTLNGIIFPFTNNARPVAPSGPLVFSGGWGGGANHKFNEILFFNSILTEAQRQQVEGYLAWKWSLTTSAGIVSPSTIPGLQLWLDGADTTTMTFSGSNVLTWLDKSPNSNTITRSGTPTYSSSNLGIGAISFNGTDAYFVNSTLPVNLTDYSVFFVCQQTSYVNNSTGILVLTNGNSIDYASLNTFIYAASMTSSNAYFEWGNGAGFYRPTPYSLTPFSIYADVTSGSTKNFFRNGNLLQTQTFANLTSSLGFLVGARKESGTAAITRFFSGFIGEVIIFNRSLSTSERQNVDGYLAWKWGLQATLPSTHPYDSQFALPGSHPYTSVRPIMRAFQPIDIGSPEFWYDAGDTSTITSSGTTLTSIANKGSVVGSNMTPSVGTHTTGVATQKNTNLIGLPTNGRLVFTGSFPLQPRSRFVAARQATSTGVIFLYQNFTSFNGHDAFGFDNGRIFYEVAQGINVSLLTPAAPVQTNLFGVYTFLNATTAAGNRVAITGSNVALSTSTFAQSYFTASANNFVGGTGSYDLGEWISYNTTLTIPQAQQIEGYLAWKWGVQANLPTTHPYYRVLPSTPLFVPSQLSGLSLWLDAADTSTLSFSSGSNVSQWRDKSGNGRNFTGTNVVYNSGSRALSFNGTSASMSNTTQPFLSNSLNWTIFAVHISAVTSSGVYQVYRTTSAALLYRYRYAGYPSEWHVGGNNYITCTANNGNGISCQVTETSTTATGYLNGVRIGSATRVTSTGVEGLFIGQNSVNQEWFNGTLYEIIAYNIALTSSQREQVEGYLAWKWGLQNLTPATHPYRKFRA